MVAVNKDSEDEDDVAAADDGGDGDGDADMVMMMMLMGTTEQMVGGEWLQSAMVRVDPAVGEFKHCPHPRLHLKC